MSTDEQRRTETLDAVASAWRASPELRLGQLLWALATVDPFYIPDEALALAALKWAAEKASTK